MPSLTISEIRVEQDAFNPEIIRAAIRAGQKNGTIKVAGKSAVPAGPLTPDQIREITAQAKAKGLLSIPHGPQNPLPVARSGKLAAEDAGVVTQWMLVSPEMAAQWLRNNFVNRPMSDDVIAAYARDMLNGQWIQTHQGIAFNDRDHLIDGQHRLTAIVRSGLTVAMMVTFGLPSKIEGSEMTTMDAVDRGRTRSVADQLKIQHGMKNGSAIASITAALANLCYNHRTRRLSVGQTLEIYRAFQESVDLVIAARPKDPGLKNVGVLAAFAFARTADPERAHRVESLFDFLSFEGQTPPGKPIRLLREFLISDDAKLLSRGTHRGVAELTLKAIRLSLAGQDVDELNLSPAGLDHFRSLIPEIVGKVAAIFTLK